MLDDCSAPHDSLAVPHDDLFIVVAYHIIFGYAASAKCRPHRHADRIVLSLRTDGSQIVLPVPWRDDGEDRIARGRRGLMLVR